MAKRWAENQGKMARGRGHSGNEVPPGKPLGIKGRTKHREPSRSRLRGIDPRGNRMTNKGFSVGLSPGNFVLMTTQVENIPVNVYNSRLKEEEAVAVKGKKSGSTIRCDLVLERGAEEFLHPDFYAFAGTGLWIDDSGKDTIVHCYPENVGQFLEYLKIAGTMVRDVRMEQEEACDYEGLVRRYFRPLKIGGVSVVPPWSNARREGIRIVIDPGMAFGTGRHESTRIMFALMEKIDFRGRTVLDIGCGSAILSIYARVLGAHTVTSVDNDLDAVQSALRNIYRNDTGEVSLVCADLENIRGSYDIVLANLDIRTFRQHAHHITGLLRKGGYLIVSGLLKTEAADIHGFFPGIHPRNSKIKNGWCGFIFR